MADKLCSMCKVPIRGRDRLCGLCRHEYNLMRASMTAPQWRRYVKLRRERRTERDAKRIAIGADHAR